MADEPEAIFPDQGFPSSPPMLAASSPLVLPASAPLSPTSSVPAVFSSDDPCEGDEISNYKAPRNKRKRAGHWVCCCIHVLNCDILLTLKVGRGGRPQDFGQKARAGTKF